MYFNLDDLTEVPLGGEPEVEPGQSERRPGFLVDPDPQEPAARRWFAFARTSAVSR